MKHFMQLKRKPFEHIAAGKKTIELRLYDEKRQAICVGDTIVFHHADNDAQTLTVNVTALHRFDSFQSLYAALPLEKCGYSPEEIPTARPSDMTAYYSEDKQRQHGVVGIEFVLITASL